jgi:general stress protein YciG
MDKSVQTVMPSVDSNTSVEEIQKPRKPRGFAAMTNKERLKEIARLGGKSAHAQGRAHRFTSEEAREAGKKGGAAPHIRRGRGKRLIESSEKLPGMNEAPASKVA